MRATRTERDTLGAVAVPAEAYWGSQTQRAIENFQISGRKPAPSLVRACVLIKRAAAEVNHELGMLDSARAQAIVAACVEVLAGGLSDHFVVDPFQAGAGTSHNMNVNEVLANRAGELLGGARGSYDRVHPNDHVNMSQSTNDTFPAAMRVALLSGHAALRSSQDRLIAAFHGKGVELDGIMTSARTHLQDAVPIRLGQEFSGWSDTLARARRRLEESAVHLHRTNLGATAAGTGINSHPDYHRRMVQRLGELTALPIEPVGNLIEIASSTADFAWYSAALRALGADVHRIANDLRLLASGPNTGIFEIQLPAVQPGSSIMPGKVNPSILECVNQVCIHVIGLDAAVALASQSGQLQLNVMMPVLFHDLHEMQSLLTPTLAMLADRCIVGIRANEDVCRRYFEGSASLATALNPIIGYARSAEIVKRALREGRSVIDVVREEGILTEEQMSQIFEPRRLTEPGLPAPPSGR